MRGRFHERVALVTGAANGIGRATAIAFAREGARVAVADLDAAGGAETVRMIEAEGGTAIFVQADVSNPADVAAMVDGTIDTFGRVDCAFNNAGIEGASAPTHECTEDNWDRVLAINLKGIWLCMKAEIPYMVAVGGGSIVNCASIAGLVGFAGSPAYVASKHGVVGLTKTAALDYATQGIRVNAVCPGVIRTPMVERVIEANPQMEAILTSSEPVGRLGRPEEIADTVLWLCNPGAAFVTGQAIAVDGGWVAR